MVNKKINTAKHPQAAGFGALGVILTILVVAAICLIAGYVFGHSRPASPVTNSTSSLPHTSRPTPTSTASDTSTFKINDLGIELQHVPVSLKDIYYAPSSNADTGQMFAYFSTATLRDLDAKCSADSMAIGTIERVSGTYDSQKDQNKGEFLKQFNGFWIGYGHPQAACSQKASAKTTQSQQMDDFSKLVHETANIVALN